MSWRFLRNVVIMTVALVVGGILMLYLALGKEMTLWALGEILRNPRPYIGIWVMTVISLYISHRMGRV